MNKKKFENKKGDKLASDGIIQLLILIVIGIFLMSYFHITFKEFIDSFMEAFHNVFP